MKNTSVDTLNSSELSFFCAQVAMILKSGMLIIDGIEWIYNDIEEGSVKAVLGVLRDEMSKNIPLHKAMELSGFFPNYMVNMSYIGNVTGKLEEVMLSLSEYYDRENVLKSKIKSSILYPSLLFIMMSFVIVLLVLKIFPIFESMANELGGEYMGSSSYIKPFSFGIFIGKLMFVMIFIILFSGCLLYVANKTKKGKSYIRHLSDKIKFMRKITRKITAYRLASSLSLLLSSGMNLEKSFDILLDAAEDSQLKSNIVACRTKMESGSSFIDGISSLKLFSSIHIQMLNMGQRAGEMDLVMKKLTDIYENEADLSINNAVALIEPILVGTLCVVIGFILISVMLPLMNIMSQIG